MAFRLQPHFWRTGWFFALTAAHGVSELHLRRIIAHETGQRMIVASVTE